MTDTTSDASAIFGTGQFFQRGNYAPVTDELTEFDLPVEGAIPAELDGWYLRNGPNPRQATAHWFTGDGMIHGVRLEGGRAAWYRNRWVRTDSFKNDFPLYNADGTRNLRSSIANTHVVNHAGKTLALVESSLPYEITNDLETVGAYDFGGKLVDSMTAHPKICPTTGELHFFGYGNIFEPHVTYHRADANGELTINRPLDVKALTMMHDFALTAEHVIFMDLPIVFNLDIAMKGDGDMPYRWDDNYGARLGVHAPRRSVRRGALVRDRPVLRVPRRQRVRRWPDRSCCKPSAIPNCGATVAHSTKPTGVVELDDRPADRQGQRTSARRPVGGVPAHRRPADRAAGPLCRLGRHQQAGALRPEHRRRGRAHASARRSRPAVPVRRCSFRRRAGRPTRANGWYLGYVYDPARDGSDLVILDASDFAGKPVARIKLPHRVPYGFHGNWIQA